MKKIAIIGASYLQLPLIERAKSLGIETHVFAWAANDVGEKVADYFYPISIVEKEQILEKCREIGIDGVCSIASDLAAVTVNYVAMEMGLTGNTLACTEKSTNKHLMRQCFATNGDPSPKSILVDSVDDLVDIELCYPVIVKPLDRSGSRGITKLYNSDGLSEAIENAKSVGFIKKALVEEFAEGQEYSVECISYQGKHHFLALTQKYTTGSPRFIETGHIEPVALSVEKTDEIKAVTYHALTGLEIENSASHTEIKIDAEGNIKIIEVGGRMGGDCIGSDLVYLSTGVDFVKAVIDVAMGYEPDITIRKHSCAAIRFVFHQSDLDVLAQIEASHPEYIIRKDIHPIQGTEIADSSERFGYYLLSADSREALMPYMP